MRDANERLLYAVNLHQRFIELPILAARKTFQTAHSLIHEVWKISWEICESEQDAELRENLLLRTHRPKFNRMNTYLRAFFH